MKEFMVFPRFPALSFVFVACASDATTGTAGVDGGAVADASSSVCPSFERVPTDNMHVVSADADARYLLPGVRSLLTVGPLLCVYDRSLPSAEQLRWVRCRQVPVDGLTVVFHFNTAISQVTPGRVLRMGEDFAVDQFYDDWEDPMTGLYTRTRPRGPLRGSITITVIGPPVVWPADARFVPTLPQMRIAGHICADPLNLELVVSTAEREP